MQTITFSEQDFGSSDPIYRCKINTIQFHGQIVDDPAQATTPVLAHDTTYMGPVSWTFSAPVDRVEFDVGYFDDLGTTTVKFFDAAGNLLERETNNQLGFQHFVYSNKVGIARIVVNNDKQDQQGFGVDNVSFRNQPPQVNLTNSDDINGLLWGWKWDHKNLTYSFPTSSDEYAHNGYKAVTGFSAMNAAQQSAYATILANVQGVCGLTFTQTANENADIRFAQADTIDYSDGSGAHVPGSRTAEGNAPDPGKATVSWGDCWFSHATYDTPTVGSFAFAAGLMHELGHSLGLKHGHVSQGGHGVTFPQLPEDHNSFEYSVMTYHQYVGDVTPGDSAIDHPTTLMQDDIAALQYLYGADFSFNNGDTVYSWDDNNQLLINGVGQGTPVNHRALLTIWDGGGVDTYDFSNKTTKLTVNLNAGEGSIFGPLADLGDMHHMARANVYNALLYKGNTASLIENATGGTGNDKFVGNVLANTLIGGDGNDRLDGSYGNDILTGGNGKDVFIFSKQLDGATNVDTITDYTVGSDLIRLETKVFDALSQGVLDPNAFFDGAQAHDKSDRIIYDDTTGALMYDADGSKNGAEAIKFAQLSVGLALTNTDFVAI